MQTEDYGQKFQPGDTVGCGVHFARRSVFFTYNGRFLGTAFNDVKLSNHSAALSLNTHGEEVTINFGETPFRFDVDTMLTDQAYDTYREVLKERVTADVLFKLVHNYLISAGFASTLKCFEDEAGYEFIRSQEEKGTRVSPSPGPCVELQKQAKQKEARKTTSRRKPVGKNVRGLTEEKVRSHATTIEDDAPMRGEGEPLFRRVPEEERKNSVQDVPKAEEMHIEEVTQIQGERREQSSAEASTKPEEEKKADPREYEERICTSAAES